MNKARQLKHSSILSKRSAGRSTLWFAMVHQVHCFEHFRVQRTTMTKLTRILRRRSTTSTNSDSPFVVTCLPLLQGQFLGPRHAEPKGDIAAHKLPCASGYHGWTVGRFWRSPGRTRIGGHAEHMASLNCLTKGPTWCSPLD
jgi:hypothetical protein